MLKTLPKQSTITSPPIQHLIRRSDSPPSSIDSPTKLKNLRRVSNKISPALNQKGRRLIAYLNNEVVKLHAKLTIKNIDSRQLECALQRSKSLKKRRKKPVEELRARSRVAAVFLSPSKYKEVVKIAEEQEQEKVQSQQDKKICKQLQQEQKAQIKINAQKKRVERVERAAARKIEAAAKKDKAQRKQEEKKAQKERDKQQRASKQPILNRQEEEQSSTVKKKTVKKKTGTAVEPIVDLVKKQRRTKSGRITKASRRFDI